MLFRLHREEGERPQLERVDPASLCYEPGRRRVLLFPGEGLSDHSFPGTMVGSLKYAEQTLASAKAQDPSVDVLLYTYEMPEEDYGAKRDHYRQQRHSISHYGRNATNFAVLPLLLRIDERLSDMTPELLKQRMSTLTLFGHSYGSIAIQDVANTLARDLHNLGWDDSTIAHTMKEVVEISVAPIARGDYPAPNFTKFYFTAVNDMTAVDRIRLENRDRAEHIPILKASGYSTIAKIIESHEANVPRAQLLDEVNAKVMMSRRPGVTPRASLEKLPCGYALTAMLPDDEIRWIERNSEGHMVCRHLSSADAKQHGMSVAHDWRTYLHGDHTLGQLLINTANNAVMREPGIGDGHLLMMNSELTRNQLHTRSAANERASVSERGILVGEREGHGVNGTRRL